MAWNRASEASRDETTGEQGNSHLKGIIAGLIVVAGATVAAIWLFRSPAQRQVPDSSEKKGLIKEVKPAVPKPPQGPVVTNRFGKVVPKLKRETYVDERGVRRFKNGQRCYDGVPLAPKPKSRAPSSVFRHGSEREIEALITLPPGGRLFGHREYGKRFLEDFEKSLSDPIVISDDDSDSVKELKQAMIDTKAELKARADKGEDIGQIMKESYDEVMRLAVYKDDVEKMVRETVKSNDLSEKDCRDLVSAANLMLSEKGIAPVGSGPIIRMNLKLKAKRQLEEGQKK